MRRVISIALLATMTATTAHAITAFLDVDGDEKASFDEMTFTYPDLSRDVIADPNGDI